MEKLITKVCDKKNLSDSDLLTLINNNDIEIDDLLTQKADEIRRKYYGNKVFLRGLIEISNFCKNNCLYCGIRCENKKVERYRLSYEEILNCCKIGYELGLRTFVIQSGEDLFFTDEITCGIIEKIKHLYPECAVTLSMGERSYESYKLLKKAGADRYLLRHESADECLYKKIHPQSMKLEGRTECLYNLKRLGYQVGAGFMVNAPYQTSENILKDIRFLQNLNPEMIGIGPFIPHSETPFSSHKSGSLRLTIRLLSIIRLMFPKVLLPATTALGTLHKNGREMGLMSGCNVVMPNISPIDNRKKYNLYNNKICTGEETAEGINNLKKRIEAMGYQISIERGDSFV